MASWVINATSADHNRFCDHNLILYPEIYRSHSVNLSVNLVYNSLISRCLTRDINSHNNNNNRQ